MESRHFPKKKETELLQVTEQKMEVQSLRKKQEMTEVQQRVRLKVVGGVHFPIWMHQVL